MADTHLSQPDLTTSRVVIVMEIDGHDWRYVGGGWKLLPKDNPQGLAGWDRYVRTGYTKKLCMTCGFAGRPDDQARPCHELWAERTGYPASAGSGKTYWPAREKAA